jgi:hypothetical protein
VNAAQQQRMVREQSVRAQLERLVDGRRHRVDRQQHPAQGRIARTGDEADAVPPLGGRGGPELLGDAPEIGEGARRG